MNCYDTLYNNNLKQEFFTEWYDNITDYNKFIMPIQVQLSEELIIKTEHIENYKSTGDAFVIIRAKDGMYKYNCRLKMIVAIYSPLDLMIEKVNKITPLNDKPKYKVKFQSFIKELENGLYEITADHYPFPKPPNGKIIVDNLKIYMGNVLFILNFVLYKINSYKDKWYISLANFQFTEKQLCYQIGCVKFYDYPMQPCYEQFYSERMINIVNITRQLFLIKNITPDDPEYNIKFVSNVTTLMNS